MKVNYVKKIKNKIKGIWKMKGRSFGEQSLLNFDLIIILYNITGSLF